MKRKNDVGEKPRIAFVGCGAFMYDYFYDRMLRSSFETAAVCDLDPVRLERFAARYNVQQRYTDYRRMLGDCAPDGVVCAVGPAVHAEVAARCLRAGIPVFVEKAPCADGAEAERLAGLQRETGTYGMVGFNRRWATGYAMAAEIASRPEFGRPSMYLAEYHASPYGTEERFVSNHLIHHLDLARFFVGEIDSVRAEIVRRGEGKVGIVVSFVAASGLVGSIHSGSLRHESYPMERVELTGDLRCVVVENLRSLRYRRPASPKSLADEPTLPEGADTLSWEPNLGAFGGYSDQGFEKEFAHFLSCVRSGDRPRPDLEDAAKTMALLDRVRVELNVG